MDKLIEDMRQVFGWNSASGVLDRNSDVIAAVLSIDLDVTVLCMAKGINNQVVIATEAETAESKRPGMMPRSYLRLPLPSPSESVMDQRQ